MAIATIKDFELPWFIPSPEDQVARDRLLRSKYFLVRIKGNGDVWRCKRCGNKHNYLTLQCIEQPFSGITGGLYAYYHTININGAVDLLNEKEKARYDRLQQILSEDGRPDLASSHPQTAREIGTEFNSGDKGAFALGLLVDISQVDAQALVDRINGTGIRPRLVVEGLRRNW